MVGITLALGAALLAMHLYDRLDHALLIDENYFDLWFDADSPRTFENMFSRMSDFTRSSLHPLSGLLVSLPLIAARNLTGLPPFAILRCYLGLLAFLQALGLFSILRLIGFGPLVSGASVALFVSSASFIFWSGVIENFGIGALSMMVCVMLAASRGHRDRMGTWIAATALSMSVTLTNWMAGLVAAYLSLKPIDFVRVTLLALAVVAGLTAVQSNLFPFGGPFFRVLSETHYTNSLPRDSAAPVARAFFVHTMVAPDIGIAPHPYRSGAQILTVQPSAVGSSGILGIAATVAWGLLCSMAILGAARDNGPHAIRATILAVIAGQFLLHVFYGWETFLYSAHWAWLLALLAAYSFKTPWPRMALGLMLATAVLATANNLAQFGVADAMADATPEQRKVEVARALRPTDPWPRSINHAVLGSLGTGDNFKAYVDPAGGFSPAFSSFGISFWLVGPADELLATSERGDLGVAQQRYETDIQGRPTIATETPAYHARWVAVGPGHFRLFLRRQPSAAGTLVVAVRSVGPAGGPIHNLSMSSSGLSVNDRWTVDLKPSIAPSFLGEEGDEDWLTARNKARSWTSKQGWGHARFALSDDVELVLDLRDRLSWPERQGGHDGFSIPFELSLPDETFVASARAQLTTILHGLVGAETRPGDPAHYPLAWQRDGTYVLAAMTRAGRLDLARELARPIAEKDFFGGFGTEADAPGLALWSLAETAQAIYEPAFDEALWPHIVRKAELIQRMLQADGVAHHAYEGRVIPAHRNDPGFRLVVEAATDGLIRGRMDHHYPLLYVNAVSYRGLMDAATLAERRGADREALAWRRTASQLRDAWRARFQADLPSGPEAVNPRSYAVGLWPSGIADPAPYAAALERRWQSSRDPQGGFLKRPAWTYFDLAEAHQWLYLDRPDRAWPTLRWFWTNTPSPGLYTLWEGPPVPDYFGRWQKARAAGPRDQVVPHYWSAAELLMLQLDMLAYVAEDADPALVLGAGIPADWTAKPMRVERIVTRRGSVDWRWDGRNMQVSLPARATSLPIRLGKDFPSNASIEIVTPPR